MMLQPQGPQLRDIHVPPASWWPPAPGWWILAVLLLLAVALALWWLRVLQRKRRIRRVLAGELERIRQDFSHSGDRPRLAAALSQLLRRAVRLHGGDSQLRGNAWRDELQRIVPGRVDAEQAALLEQAPYQRSADFDAESLLRSCEAWLHEALEVRHA